MPYFRNAGRPAVVVSTLGLLTASSLSCLREVRGRNNEPRPEAASKASEETGNAAREVYSAAVSDDGQVMAIGLRGTNFDNDHDIRLFATDPLRLETVRPMERFSHNLAISPDGRWIAADEDGGTGESRCYLIDSRNLRITHILHGAVDYAELAFTADSRFVVGASNGSFIGGFQTAGD